MADKEKSQFERFNAMDVSEHVSQIKPKEGARGPVLSYLSWVYGWSLMKKEDPTATREYREFDELGSDGKLTGRKVPYMLTAQGAYVECTVTINGVSETETLPVMDYKNHAILRPDTMQINKAKQRCFVKALALHGIGLYIYAGEDFPSKDDDDAAVAAQAEVGKHITEAEAVAAKQIIFDIATRAGSEFSTVLITLEKRARIIEDKSNAERPIEALSAAQYGNLMRAVNESEAKVNKTAKTA